MYDHVLVVDFVGREIIRNHNIIKGRLSIYKDSQYIIITVMFTVRSLKSLGTRLSGRVRYSIMKIDSKTLFPLVLQKLLRKVLVITPPISQAPVIVITDKCDFGH